MHLPLLIRPFKVTQLWSELALVLQLGLVISKAESTLWIASMELTHCYLAQITKKVLVSTRALDQHAGHF